MPFPDPFSRQAAQDLVRELADFCRVDFSDHLFDQADLRDVDPADVMRALCRGEVRADPEWDANERNWVVQVYGSVAGTNLRIPLGVEEDGNYFTSRVITVIVL